MKVTTTGAVQQWVLRQFLFIGGFQGVFAIRLVSFCADILSSTSWFQFHCYERGFSGAQFSPAAQSTVEWYGSGLVHRRVVLQYLSPAAQSTVEWYSCQFPVPEYHLLQVPDSVIVSMVLKTVSSVVTFIFFLVTGPVEVCWIGLFSGCGVTAVLCFGSRVVLFAERSGSTPSSSCLLSFVVLEFLGLLL
jgi:hypothetical protein